MPEHDEPLEMAVRPRSEPAPANAEAMLQALIKTNQSERDIVQSEMDELTQEAHRLDTIREGLQGALRAARSGALRSVVPSR
jgi:hypothetical protein